MAAAAKKKKKEKSTNPNLALVIFLVFFILVTIGLGVWGYYGYAGQEELRAKKIGAEAVSKSDRNLATYYEMLYRDARTALGEKLDGDEEKELHLYRDEFLKDDFGNFKTMKNKEAARKLIDANKKRLGVHEDGKNYRSDFATEINAALVKVKDMEGKLNASIAQHEKTKELIAKFTEKQDDFHKDAMDRITKGNAAALARTQVNSKSFADVTENNRKLRVDLDEKEQEIGRINEEHQKQINALKREIAGLQAERKEAAGGAQVNLQRNANDFFPLVLDISMGKPLWDFPVGKIMRVDPELRQVAINIGSAHGAKRELTFNVFGPNSSGRAEKQLKGSIEIIRVVDANTSLARITSLYDVEGLEIKLNDLTRTRVMRESEAPIREGDLLFNLFWGTRVAVAGYVSITGEGSDNPAEQIRQMEDFAELLQRNGMQVDAFVDLRDGQIRGNITSKTRYLIRGDDLRAPRAAKMAKEKEGDDEKPGAKDQPGGDRIKLVNDANLALRIEAKERGMLMISAENFASMIGYRQARSANMHEVSNFRPRLPYAGAPSVEARPKMAPDDKNGAEMMKEKEAGN